MVQTKPYRTLDHLHKAIHPSLKDLMSAIRDVNGINAKIAVFVTKLVGTMWCAYCFAVIALIGLPAALRPGGEGIIAWIAQTFLQLVLLSVIIVGQNVQSLAAEARAENTLTDTEAILDRLDLGTDGGLKVILDRLDRLESQLRDRSPSHPAEADSSRVLAD